LLKYRFLVVLCVKLPSLNPKNFFSTFFELSVKNAYFFISLDLLCFRFFFRLYRKPSLKLPGASPPGLSRELVPMGYYLVAHVYSHNSPLRGHYFFSINVPRAINLLHHDLLLEAHVILKKPKAKMKIILFDYPTHSWALRLQN
jgi:hypothetical protein